MTGKSGSVILSIIFMALVMFLGLSLLNVSIIHNRVLKGRNIHRSRSESLKNILIRQLHDDRNKIKNTVFESSIENFENYFNKTNYPDSSENLNSIVRTFSCRSRNFPMFRKIRGLYNLKVIGPRRRHQWNSSTLFNIISGDIPVNLIPVIINPPAADKNEKAPEQYNLNSKEPDQILISNHETVFNIALYIADILGIESCPLTIGAVMARFGRRDNHNGIFFIESETETGPVFIQGDVKSISLSTENDFQVIEIISEGHSLKFRYTDHEFHYLSDLTPGSIYKSFDEKIIVNGKVNILRADGYPALAPGSRPELIVLGDINISSSITGIKTGYQRNPDPGITIISGPSPFSGDNHSPIISFISSGPIIIQGSLNVNGIIRNDHTEVNIRGNLFCRELKNSGKISVIPDPGYTPVSPGNFYIKNIAFIRDIRTEEIGEYFDNEI